MQENLKFYSQKAIAIATYFGGPLAAGILIRKNCLNLGKEKQAVNSLIIGIVSTIFIFVGIFMIPENIIDKIPNVIIPAIYTGIIYLIVEKIQGNELKSHKENNGEFYSGWKAAGIGAISMIIIAAGMFGYILATEPSYDFDTVTYNNEINVFSINEAEALMVFELAPTLDRNVYIQEYRNGIKKWKENIQILERINKIENLPEEFIIRNNKLVEYCNLRIHQYENGIRAISSQTDKYDKETQEIVNKIGKIIDELN